MGIRVGDCLSEQGDAYEEIACEGDEAPSYKVVEKTLRGKDCPREDDLVLGPDTLMDRVGLSNTVYCARPV